MDKSLIRSLAWKVTSDWVSQIFSWVSLIIVMRLLTPADFGIVGMAVILLPYLQYISEFGITRAIVTLRELSEDQVAQLNTLAVILGLIFFGIASLLARPFAEFFKTPRLTPVVILTCAALLPLGLRAVSEGLLSKEMRFRELSIFNAMNALAAAAVTLGMAIAGFGYWALVWGNLAGVILRTFLIVRARPHRFAIPRPRSIGEPLRFGWHVLVSMVALNSYQRLDNVTAGRVLGQSALGAYGMAWSFAYVPLEKVTSLVTTVVPTYFAAVQKELSQVRRYLLTLSEGVALITFPATVGLGLVARELVPVVFGRKWDGVIAPLEVLSIYAAFRSVVALLPKVLTAVGNARYVMWNDLGALIILPVAFYIGSHWGTAGIAWGWVAAYPLVALPLYHKTFATIEMKTGEYFRALWPALEGTLLMTLAVGFCKYAIHSALPVAVRLSAEITCGAIIYMASLLVFHRDRMFAFVRAIKAFRQSKPRPAS